MTFKPSARLWEIDFFRGLAVIMMLVYHFVVDVEFVYELNINPDMGAWKYFQIATASLFLILAGISLTLKNKPDSINNCFTKYFCRGIAILSLGMLITLFTRLILKDGYIVFGILHLIGLSTILAFPLIRLKFTNIFIGTASILLGAYVEHIILFSPALIFLGISPPHFYSIDYFPLFPWFGLVLIGVSIGNLLYPNCQPVFRLKDYSGFLPIKLFCLIGRKSLVIYLIHQPMLFAGILFGKWLF